MAETRTPKSGQPILVDSEEWNWVLNEMKDHETRILALESNAGLLPSPSPTPTISPSPSRVFSPSPTPSNTPSPSASRPSANGLYFNGRLLTNTPAIPYDTALNLDQDVNTFTQVGAGDYTLAKYVDGTGSLNINIGTANTLTFTQPSYRNTDTRLISGVAAISSPDALGKHSVEFQGGNIRVNYAAFSVLPSPNNTAFISMSNTFHVPTGKTGYIDMIGNGTVGNDLDFRCGNTYLDGSLRISRSAGNYGTTIFNSAFSGAGTLVVDNTNGGVAPTTSINGQGRLSAAHANAFDAFTGKALVLAGGNLYLSGGQLLQANNNDVELIAGGYLTLEGGQFTFIDELLGAGIVTRDTGGTDPAVLSVHIGTLTGGISSVPIGGDTTIALRKIGDSVFTLGGANDYSSGTTILTGALTIQHVQALGTGDVNIYPDGTLNKGGFTPANTINNQGGTVNP